MGIWLPRQRLLELSETAKSQASGLNGIDAAENGLLPLLWSSAMLPLITVSIIYHSKWRQIKPPFYCPADTSLNLFFFCCLQTFYFFFRDVLTPLCLCLRRPHALSFFMDPDRHFWLHFDFSQIIHTSHLWVADSNEKLGGNAFQQEHSVKLNSDCYSFCLERGVR